LHKFSSSDVYNWENEPETDVKPESNMPMRQENNKTG